jgi:hypothetical protein
MLRSIMDGSNNTDRALTLGRSCLLVVKCSCGAEILLVPDAAAMGAAIERHVVEHKRRFGLSDKQAEDIRDLLIIQMFELAVKNCVLGETVSVHKKEL